MDLIHPEDRYKCFLRTNCTEPLSVIPLNGGNGGTPTSATGRATAISPGVFLLGLGDNIDHSSRYQLHPMSTSPGTGDILFHSNYLSGGREASYQTGLKLKRSDGKFRWFLVKCKGIEVVELGRKWFGTCADVNDQKLLEHKLKEAHDATQRSTESKTWFLSNMSHEIRTPLVGITGMINFLITTELTNEQFDYVHTVQQSADALILVINNILDHSKVEAGMMKLEMEPFSIHSMIEDANELLSTLAIQKDLELGVLVEDSVPEVVIGD